MNRTALRKNIDFIEDNSSEISTTRMGKFMVTGELKLLESPIVGLWIPEKCDGDAILKVYDFACMVRNSQITIACRFTTTMEKEVYQILSKKEVRMISIGDCRNDLKSSLQIFIKGAKSSVATDASAIELISNAIVVGSDKFERAPFNKNGDVGTYCLTDSSELPALKLNGSTIKKLIATVPQKQKKSRKSGELVDSI